MRNDVSRRYVLIAVCSAGSIALVGCSDNNSERQMTGRTDGETTEEDTETESREVETTREPTEPSGVSDPATPGYSFEGAPVLAEGRHGPYELNLETRDNRDREHYFAVHLDEGDVLTVNMNFTAHDLDMSIHSPEYNDYTEQYRKITGSASTTPNETASITASKSGTHYIRTYIVTYGVTSEYELEIEVEESEAEE